jgi:DnaK suppressor protein
MRERLASERASTEETIAALQRDHASIVAATGEANDDEHDPEGSTIAFERAQVAALLAAAREHLAALERAGERLAAGTYGVCERCGVVIPEDRLAALPATSTCVRCAGELLKRR